MTAVFTRTVPNAARCQLVINAVSRPVKIVNHQCVAFTSVSVAAIHTVSTVEERGVVLTAMNTFAMSVVLTFVNAALKQQCATAVSRKSGLGLLLLSSVALAWNPIAKLALRSLMKNSLSSSVPSVN